MYLGAGAYRIAGGTVLRALRRRGRLAVLAALGGRGRLAADADALLSHT